jgi:hypothetical protein
MGWWQGLDGHGAHRHDARQGLRNLQAAALEGDGYALLALGRELLHGRLVQQNYHEVRRV